jgi:hypothetical protein
MAFLTPADFTSRLYAQKIAAISNGDDTLLPIAINTAIAEAQLYLSRYNITDLFGKVGDDRDPILLQWLKDITVWQFIGLSNPGIDYEDAELRRNNAISGLKNVQNANTPPVGWLLVTATDGSGNDPSQLHHAGSLHRKRDTYRDGCAWGENGFPWDNCN